MVRSGDVVRVKVLGVDAARKRISLTLRLDDEPGGEARAPREAPAKPNRNRGGPAGAMAEALRRAGLG
jgi:uncharacterized protein